MRISGARTYPHRGNVLFLTVAVSRERPNVWRYLVAEADDDSEVVGEDDYLQGASRAKVQKENVVAMDDSQLAAKKVALEQLGYTVVATGKGALVEQVLRHGPAVGHLHAGDVITAIDGQPIQLARRGRDDRPLAAGRHHLHVHGDQQGPDPDGDDHEREGAERRAAGQALHRDRGQHRGSRSWSSRSTSRSTRVR